MPIAVQGFKLSDFKALIRNLFKVHAAELSIYETKAKLLRLSRVHAGYDEPLRQFGKNLESLRLDEKFVFHHYDRESDDHLNQLLRFAEDTDAFDLAILSQAFTVGELLTEDRDLLALKDKVEFSKSTLSTRIKISCWKDINQIKFV